MTRKVRSGGIFPHNLAAQQFLTAEGFTHIPGYGPLKWRDGKVTESAFITNTEDGEAIVTIVERDQ
jgi:hypothetical protein